MLSNYSAISWLSNVVVEGVGVPVVQGVGVPVVQCAGVPVVDCVGVTVVESVSIPVVDAVGISRECTGFKYQFDIYLLPRIQKNRL